MSDDTNLGDKVEQEVGDSREPASESVKTAALEGAESAANETKAYHQFRRDGGRDPDTQEHLPPQPEFFDSASSSDVVQTLKNFNPKDAVAENRLDAGAPEGEPKGEPKGESKGEPKEGEPKGEPTDKPKGEPEGETPAFGSVVITDKDDRVKRTTDDRGNTTNYEYDKDGNLETIKFEGGKTLKRENGVWAEYRDGHKDAEYKGDFSVNEDGDLAWVGENGSARVDHIDGSITTINKDQSQMTVDKDDRVTATTDARGNKTNYEYDKDGNLETIKFEGGKTMKRENGAWAEYRDGHKDAEYKGDFSVTQDGDLAWVGEGGGGRVDHLDGSITTINKDQSQMTMDKDGRVTTTTDARGSTATYGYDESGSLTSVAFADGKTMKKENGSWVEYRGAEKGNSYKGDFAVTDEGDLAWVGEDGFSRIDHLDGKVTTIKPDQSQTTVDKNDKVISEVKPVAR